MLNRSTLDREILETRNRLAALEAEASKLTKIEQGLSEPQKLAVLIHEKKCRHNHVDACDWEYRDLLDPNTWQGQFSVHKEYLDMAEKVLALVDMNLCKKILEALY